MRVGMWPFGLLAVLGGGGYAAYGERDFSVEVQRPLAETYAEFSGIHTFGSGLRDEGIDVPKVQIVRPSDHEIVFSTQGADPEKQTRIALTFTAIDNGRATEVQAAIDVPKVDMSYLGQNKVLSESKVESTFEEGITEMAREIERGDASQASHKLSLLLDVLAITAHPAKGAALKRRADQEERAQKAEFAARRAEAKAELDEFTASFSRPEPEYGDPAYNDY